MLLANSPAAGLYAWLFDMPVEIGRPAADRQTPPLWVNDGLI